MGIFPKEEHLLDGVSAIMSSELRHDCNQISLLKYGFTTCSHRFSHSLVLNLHLLTPYILTSSYFLTEHAIKHNQKQTSTPPLAIIAAVENHFLPPFASLEPPSSTPPSEKQWDCYLSNLEDGVLSSEWQHDANAYVNILFVLVRNVIQTGAHMVDGAQMLDGWWRRMILGFCMAGPSLTVLKLLPLQRTPIRITSRRKQEGGKGQWRGGKEPVIWNICYCRDYYQEIYLIWKTPQASTGHGIFVVIINPV